MIRRPKQQNPRIRERNKLLTASSVRACRILQDSWVMPIQMHEWVTFQISTASAIGPGSLLCNKEIANNFSAVCPCKAELYGRRSTDVARTKAFLRGHGSHDDSHHRSLLPWAVPAARIHTGEFGVTSKDTAIATIEGRSTMDCFASLKGATMPKGEKGQGYGSARYRT